MADQELIKQIMAEVKDPALRDKLLASLIANEPLNDTQKNALTSLGLKADAAQKTVQMWKTQNKIVFSLLFVSGLIGAVFAAKYDFFSPIGPAACLLFSALAVVGGFVNNAYYKKLA